MSTSFPLVSICIPTYNGAEFLKETLDSVTNQTYQHLEVIISDDSSSDSTLSIVQKYKDNSQLPVYIYHHTPSGIGSNWNNSIQQAKGKYIKLLFQDDLLSQNCIKSMVNTFENGSNNLGIVYSRKKLIGDATQEMQGTADTTFEKYHSYSSKQLFKSKDFYTQPRNKIGEPTCALIKKEVFDKVGYYNTRLKQSLDYEYWYRAMLMFEFASINKPLVSFRIHQNQTTSVNDKKVIIDSYLLPQILFRKLKFKLSLRNIIILIYKWNANYIRYILKK